MGDEFSRRLWGPVRSKIALRCAGCEMVRRDLPRDKTRVGEFAQPKDGIETLIDDVDLAIIQPEIEFNLAPSLHEARQRRNDHAPSEHGRHADLEPSLGHGARFADRVFGLTHIIEDAAERA
jgi:hypothetical protein